jgi:predicted nucleic acid-binding protein
VSGGFVVLDAEAVSALAAPKERSAAAKRAQAVLDVVERRGGLARIPAPVLVEVERGARAAAVNRVVNAARILPTDRKIAEVAGALLHARRLDSCHAVDALVVATAASVAPAVILTVDPDDLVALAAHVDDVTISVLP